MCGCGVEPEHRDTTQRTVREYNRRLEQLINSGKYDSDSFTVVLQIGSRDATPPMLVGMTSQP